MTGLHDLLDHTTSDPIGIDVAADLRRGRRALTRRRTRLATGVTGGLVAASVVGYVALPSGPSAVRMASPSAESGPSLVHTTYFDFATPPAGWHVVGAKPSYVMIAPDGTTPPLEGAFTGKLMILLEDKSFPMDNGSQIPFNGRTFYDNEQNGDTTILNVQDPSGDWVQAQYPHSAGFDTDAMVAFLDSVVVNPGAMGAKG